MRKAEERKLPMSLSHCLYGQDTSVAVAPVRSEGVLPPDGNSEQKRVHVKRDETGEPQGYTMKKNHSTGQLSLSSWFT